MPDLFNFWTTRTSDFTVPNMQSNLPDTALSDLNTSLDFTVDLTPKLPGGKKEESSRSLLEAQLGMILNTKANAPQYTYTDKEARRYDTPGKQFTPGQLITGGDIEDLYAKNQSAWAKLGNAGLKTMANIGGTYVSAFLSIPKQIDMIRSGNKDDIIAAFTEDGILPSIQNSLMELEDKLPNYYTEWEREHPYLSAIPFSGGAVNFWGDKVLKNIGFSVGALAAGVTQSAAIEYATAGMATPAAFLKLGSTIGKFLPNMFRGFRNLAKVSTFPGGIDDVINVAKAGKTMEEAARTAATLRKIGHGSKLLLTNYLAAQGEAYIEGYHTYYQLKEDSYKKLLNGELTPEEAATIEERAQDAGRLTSKINIPIVMVSNLLQFPRLLGVKGMKDEILESFIKMQKGTRGFELVKNFSKAKAIRNYAWESITDMAKEGAEEGAQAAFGGAVRDYYMDKYSPVRQTLVGYVEEQLKDDELYQEMFLGALSGFLMGGVPSAKKYFWNTNQRLDKAIEQMQPVVQKFNEHVRGLHSAFEISNLENTEEQDQLARFKSLFNFVSTGRKFGTYDMFMDSVQDLKDLSLDDYNQMFNTLHKTDLDKRAHIDFLTNEISEINRSIDAVETLYRRNPYKTDSYLVEKIKDAFQIQGDDLERTQAYLFDEFKTTMAFNHARMQKMSKAYDDYDNGLKSAGISTEPREYLINLARGDRKVLNQYKAYKVNQMNALNSQMDYLKEMQQQAKASDIEGATPQSYQKKIQIIQERINKMRGTLDELDKLSKDLPRMKDKEKDEFADRRQLLYLLLLNEELTPADLQKLQEEMKEPTEEEVEAAKDIVEKAADTKDTMEDYQKETENPEKVQEEIADLEAESLNQSAPPDTEKDPTPKTDDLWLEDFMQGDTVEVDGVEFEVTAVKPAGKPALSLRYKDDTLYLRKVGEGFLLTAKVIPGAPLSFAVLNAFDFNPVPGRSNAVEAKVTSIKLTKPRAEPKLNIRGETVVGVKPPTVGDIYSHSKGGRFEIIEIDRQDKVVFKNIETNTTSRMPKSEFYAKVNDETLKLEKPVASEQSNETVEQYPTTQPEEQVETQESQPEKVTTLEDIKIEYLKTKQNPDGTITVYRGVQVDGEKGTGQYWTTDKLVAEKYANRFGNEGKVLEISISFEVALKGFIGMEGNPGFAEGSDIFSLPDVYNTELQQQEQTPKLQYEKGTEEFTFDEVMSNENYKFVPSRITMKSGTVIYRSEGGKLYKQGSSSRMLKVREEVKGAELKRLQGETFNQVIMSTFVGGKVVERDQMLTKEKQEEVLAPTEVQLVKQFLKETQAKEDVEAALISAVHNGLIEIQC